MSDQNATVDFDFTMRPHDPNEDIEDESKWDDDLDAYGDEHKYDDVDGWYDADGQWCRIASVRPSARVGDVIGTTDDGRLQVVWRTDEEQPAV